MHFTSLVLAALVSAAQAVNVQVVAVGKNPVNGSTGLKYFPDKITAAPGSMVQFQFWAGNHTVTQSDFDHPCKPISQVNSSSAGIWSGYMPVTAGESSGKVPVFTIMVNDTKPIWLFCSQSTHCENGMAMVINENTAANSSRSLENYISAAARVSPGNGGYSSGGGGGYSNSTGSPGVTSPAESAPSPSSAGGSEATGTGSSAAATTTTGVPVSAAASLDVSSGLLVALGVAVFTFL